MLEIGSFAYINSRLTALEVELYSAKTKKDAYYILYSRLSNLVDFFPDKIRPFIEWWIIRIDFENIKDVSAQIFGDIYYSFSRPFIKLKKEVLLNAARNKDLSGLLDVLSNNFENFKKDDFEGLKNYSEFAFGLDNFYFKSFEDRLPNEPDTELAKKLVATKVDLLNLNLVDRVKDKKKFFLPYGLLTIEDIKEKKKLSESLFEIYGVSNKEDLKSYYYNLCKSYDTNFASVMDFIVSHEYLIEEGGYKK
ncbi:MAG: V-type ATPase subunit [Thermoproteota archaeon]|nr:V-type ATPase subunit [Candidatus Brockarchaeota archaeon]